MSFSISSALARRSCLLDTFHLQAEGNVVDEIEMGKQRIGLEHHRRAALGWRKIGDDDIAQPDIARRNALVAGNHPERRGLAAAGRAKEAAIAAGGYFQADGMDGSRAAIDLGNGYDIDFSGFGHHVSPVTGRAMHQACQTECPETTI
jgi:hypothetical protein